jgi:Mg2+ and Co2+ transporter CorA
LRNEALYNVLRTELFDAVQYLDSDILRRQSASMHRLTVVTILGLIGSIATGYLGMNLIASENSPLADKIVIFFITLGLVATLAFLTIAWSGRITRLFDWISGERN